MANNKVAAPIGQWMDTLLASLDKFVRLETKEGVKRNGRLSGFRTSHIKFNNVRRDVIMELELNGDPADCVPLAQISSINIG